MFSIPDISRTFKRGTPEIVLNVNVSTCGDQHFNDRNYSRNFQFLFACEQAVYYDAVKSRFTVVVLRIRVCSVGQQRLNVFNRSRLMLPTNSFEGAMQNRLESIPGSTGTSPGFNQSVDRTDFDALSSVKNCRCVKRCAPVLIGDIRTCTALNQRRDCVDVALE